MQIAGITHFSVPEIIVCTIPVRLIATCPGTGYVNQWRLTRLPSSGD